MVEVIHMRPANVQVEIRQPPRHDQQRDRPCRAKIIRNAYKTNLAELTIGRSYTDASSRTPCENPVRLFERFLGSNIVPEAGDFPRINGDAGVEPLDEAPGLVRVVALGNVLLDERQRRFG